MFRSKEKGLRSYRSVLILVVLIILLPLLFLYISQWYVSAPPIYEGYDELRKQANSKENGFVYLEVAESLARRLFESDFTIKDVQVFPRKAGVATVDRRLGMEISASEYLYFYYEMIRCDRLMDEWLGREDGWSQHILNGGLEVSHYVRLANRERWFIPYVPGKTQKMYVEMYPAHLMFISLVMINLWISSGDYGSALDAISELEMLFERMYEVSLSMTMPLFCSYFLSPILSNRGLPDYFYEGVECVLDRLLERLHELDFKHFYRRSLLYVEHAFADWHRNSRGRHGIWNEWRQYTTAFFMYHSLSRYLSQKDSELREMDWNDVEEAYFYRRGRLYPLLVDMQGKYPSDYGLGDDFWVFVSGSMWRRMLFARNVGLSSAFVAKLTIQLERFRERTGRYPKELKELGVDTWVDKDREWLLRFVQVYLSPGGYEVVYYPLAMDSVEVLHSSTPLLGYYRVRGSVGRWIESR